MVSKGFSQAFPSSGGRREVQGPPRLRREPEAEAANPPVSWLLAGIRGAEAAVGACEV